MQLQKLKGKLKEMSKSYEDCANAIGVTTTTFNAKMNGRTRFYIDELDALGNYLSMSQGEKADIFLT